MRLRFVLLAVAATVTVAAQAPQLDFEFFKIRVEPILLAKREGHARCYACHSTGTPYRLQRLSTGATTWNDEQSRKNFQSTMNMVNLQDPEASPLLTFPLAEKAGGNHFHPGGKHWDTKSAPEWQVLEQWAKGQKATATRQ
ncbi:MAG TPA: hypothetical protein VEU96_24990 [Bryobacteraceae bacterium]|nr:hypothetical protein [Bryobacteraceae bacterium]